MRSHILVAVSLAAAALAGSACTNELDIEQMDLEEPFDDGSNIELQGVYDCTERSDNGYRGGSRFSIDVVTVDARPVEVATANAYVAMQESARRSGVNLRIVSGFRTNSEQTYLYGCYTDCDCNDCNLAARPGYSNHQSGSALDLNTRDSGVLTWLNNNGSRFGFRRTVPSENWHWEFQGRASDFSGPCGTGAAVPSQNVAPDGCTGLGTGGIIEEDGSCVTLGGPEQYLRSVDDEFASNDSLVWTGATANANASNYAVWWVKVPSPGVYRVEAHINRTYGTSQQAKYSIRHGGRNDVITLNQTTAGGFRSLGEFTFTATAGERIRLDDNTGERSSLGRKLAIDGIRITRVEDGQSPAPTTPPAQCENVVVETGGTALNVRPTASTSQAARGTVADGAVVERLATVTTGQDVRGDRTWYEVRQGNLRGFISGAYSRCE